MPDHKTGTREEWLAARLELLDAEKALTRRGDELARWRQELPWVRIDKEYRFDTEEGYGIPHRSLPRALAAPRLSLHVRPRVHRGVSVLLGDRGRLRRLRRPPRASRRHAVRGVAGAAREAAGVPAAHGLELPVGVLARQRLQLRLPGRRTPGSSGSREPSTTTSARRTSGRRPARRVPGAPGSRRPWERTSRRTGEKGPVSARSCSRMASCTTPTRRTNAASTGSGACSSGSTARRSGRNETGFWWRRHDEYQ